MGQYEILDLLKENPNKFFTNKEIQIELNKKKIQINLTSIAGNLKRLRRDDLVSFEKGSKKTNFVHRYKNG